MFFVALVNLSPSCSNLVNNVEGGYKYDQGTNKRMTVQPVSNCHSQIMAQDSTFLDYKVSTSHLWFK